MSKKKYKRLMRIILVVKTYLELKGKDFYLSNKEFLDIMED